MLASNDQRDRTRKAVSALQFYALVVAHISALVVTVLVLLYCAKSDNKDKNSGYLGGFNWKEKTFNWHPFLMATGSIFCSTEGILAFRTWKFGKPVNKAIHASFLTMTIGLMTVGIVAVFLSHNSIEHSQGGAYAANLYSAHSWIGLSTYALFCFQWLSAVVAFVAPTPLSLKATWMPLHIIIGTASFIGAAMAVATGFAELTSWQGIGYEVRNEPALNPAAHYLDIGEGFRVALWCTFFTFLTVVCTIVSVNDSVRITEDKLILAERGSESFTF